MKEKKVNPSYLACGCAARYEIASAVDESLSASASGISMPNSSSRAMTSSTASRESRPRSPEKEAEAVTCVFFCQGKERKEVRKGQEVEGGAKPERKKPTNKKEKRKELVRLCR